VRLARSTGAHGCCARDSLSSNAFTLVSSRSAASSRIRASTRRRMLEVARAVSRVSGSPPHRFAADGDPRRTMGKMIVATTVGLRIDPRDARIVAVYDPD
jgi:hypothetical protein